MSDLDQTISKVINRGGWIDSAAKPVQNVVQRIFQSGGAVGQKIADFLNGTWLGHPLHPVLTDIPVGAWAVSTTLDAMEVSTGRKGIGRAADVAVAVGVAGAVGSAITGLADWQHTVGETRRTGLLHAGLNTLALGLFLGSMVSRASGSRSTGRMLAMAGFSIAGVSAYLGGDMVYRQKMGVDHAPEDDLIDTKGAFIPVLAEDQLAENKLTIAMLNNIPLVLLRQGERVYALAETCAHLGGPLADGQLTEGPEGQPVVVCPWHASHFDMQTGTALHGPTAYPQPCFEARINEGQVEVRHQGVSS